MEEILNMVVSELKIIIQQYSAKLTQRVPETAQGFQEDIFQTLLATQNQLYMPAQLLTESKEYLKVLELIVRYMKAGNGNGYLRKEPTGRRPLPCLSSSSRGCSRKAELTNPSPPHQLGSRKKRRAICPSNSKAMRT